MRDLLNDIWGWLFDQRGIAWSDWRALRDRTRAGDGMPEGWSGEW